jgi:hypothetical protein
VINIFEALGLPMPGKEAAEEELAAQPRGMVVREEGPAWVARWRWFNFQYLFLLGFCVVWDGFLVGWYSMAFHAQWGWAALIPVLFPIMHVAVGVGLTYGALAGLFNSTEVRVDGGMVTVRHGPVPWKGARLEVAKIEQLYVRDRGAKQRSSPTDMRYDLCALVEGTAVKVMRLDTLEQGRFLEQAIERRLGIVPRRVAGEA